jgi:cyclophilin family peptidyl-prolyl cis-trans isomerase
MKRHPLLFAGTLLLGSLLARADDVAYMLVKFPTQKLPSAVAIELYEGDAPKTVANFKKLAHKKFYDGLAFHRVFPHVLVQTGDPLSRGKDRARVGTGGPGYTLPPEIHRKHTVGAVAMGRLPDKLNPARMSNGSQFFVCLAPMPSYDGQYTVFGHVLYGLPVLDAVSAVPVDSNDNPVDRITIKSLRVLPREKLPAEVKPGAAGATPKPAKKPWWKVF